MARKTVIDHMLWDADDVGVRDDDMYRWVTLRKKKRLDVRIRRFGRVRVKIKISST